MNTARHFRTALHAITPPDDLVPNLARGLALFWGVFALLGCVVSCTSGFDPNLWWVDLRWMIHPLRLLAIGSFGLTLLAFAIAPRCGPLRRKWTVLWTGVFLIFTLWNATRFFALQWTGSITSTLPLPASLVIHGSLLVIAVALLRNQDRVVFRPLILFGTAFAAAIAFPLLQVYSFGKTDYQRRADTAVVFGARVLRDGRMTMALRDRMVRACELYRAGQVKWLILSGGPGDGAIHETDAMKEFALINGVPESALLIDREGLNTEATVSNSLQLLSDHGIRGRILGVSEFYHLPRIKLTFQAHGREVYTVPARPSHPARNFAWRSVLREVPAFWYYLARSAAQNAVAQT